jgi:hypothetical protein
MSSNSAAAAASVPRPAGNGAVASALPPRSQYRHPLPLLHPSIATDPSVSALYSLAWSLHIAILAIRAKLVEGPDFSRNAIDEQDAYLSERMEGYWDPATKSVRVLPQQSSTSHEANLASSNSASREDWGAVLWARGFFGKGSLSRSEPTWFQREKNRVTGEHGKQNHTRGKTLRC